MATLSFDETEKVKRQTLKLLDGLLLGMLRKGKEKQYAVLDFTRKCMEHFGQYPEPPIIDPDTDKGASLVKRVSRALLCIIGPIPGEHGASAKDVSLLEAAARKSTSSAYALSLIAKEVFHHNAHYAALVTQYFNISVTEVEAGPKLQSMQAQLVNAQQGKTVGAPDVDVFLW